MYKSSPQKQPYDPDAPLRLAHVSTSLLRGWSNSFSFSLPSTAALHCSEIARTIARIDLEDRNTENVAFSQIVSALATNSRTKEIFELDSEVERIRRQDQDFFDREIATEALATILSRNTADPLDIACAFLGADDPRQQLALLNAIKASQRTSTRLAEAVVPLLAHPLLFEDVLDLLSFGAKEMRPLAEAVYARLPEYMGRSAALYGPRFEIAARMLSTWLVTNNEFSLGLKGLYAPDPIERACAINLLGQPGAPLINYHTHLEKGLYDSTSRIVLREICRVYCQKPALARAHQARLLQIAQERDVAGALALDALASLSPGRPSTLEAVLPWAKPKPEVSMRDISESDADNTDDELLIGHIVCGALMRLCGAHLQKVYPIIREVEQDLRAEVRLTCAQTLQYAPFFYHIKPLVERFLTDEFVIARAALLSASKFGSDFQAWLTSREHESTRANAGSACPAISDSAVIRELISQFKSRR